MKDQRKYLVTIRENEADGTVVFSYQPKEHTSEGNSGKSSGTAYPVTVSVSGTPDQPVLDWTSAPGNPREMVEELEADIRNRMVKRAVWIKRVDDLVDKVEKWARELDWITRRIKKKLEDSEFGTHKVSALIMQADTCRIILEPVGSSSPGTEGVVDLYLMPGYDDIASIYNRNGSWFIHYDFPGCNAENESVAPEFTRESLESVLAELRQHANQP